MWQAQTQTQTLTTNITAQKDDRRTPRPQLKLINNVRGTISQPLYVHVFLSAITAEYHFTFP